MIATNGVSWLKRSTVQRPHEQARLRDQDEDEDEDETLIERYFCRWSGISQLATTLLRVDRGLDYENDSFDEVNFIEIVGNILR